MWADLHNIHERANGVSGKLEDDIKEVPKISAPSYLESWNDSKYAEYFFSAENDQKMSDSY